MKLLQFMLILLLAAMLGACQTTAEQQALAPADLKTKYMNAVQSDAEKRATRIYWIQAPSNEEIAARLAENSDND